MKHIAAYMMILFLILPAISCRKVKDYFRDPETEQLVETIHSNVLVGYAANMAMAMIRGQSFPHVVFSRSNAGFPCTTLMVIDAKDDASQFPAYEKANKITVAGLWPDESTAILSLILTDYQMGASTLDILGIKTVPVIREADHITIALASMDIQLNPDQDALLHIDLNTLEIGTELIRLDAPRPEDVYVAVLQDAYFIDVYNNSTVNDLSDDSYSITGGGQLIRLDDTRTEITQVAMVEVGVTHECTSNPVSGMALMKVTGLKEKGLPELGTVLFQFTPGCRGTAHVYAATGMYIGSNGSDVAFQL